MTLTGNDRALTMTVLDGALCAEIDLDVFFPEQGASVRPAQRICQHCPVRVECLELALSIGAGGIWGGTTERERLRLGARVSVSALPYLRFCGTAAGYVRHRTANEEPCQACREASTQAHREYAARRAAS